MSLLFQAIFFPSDKKAALEREKSRARKKYVEKRTLSSLIGIIVLHFTETKNVIKKKDEIRDAE